MCSAPRGTRLRIANSNYKSELWGFILAYQPYLDEGMQRWLHTTAMRNHWRVAGWYDIEDLKQDGYCCFYKCVERYQRLNRKRKPRKEDRRNFMALVKRAFENHIHDLARKQRVQRVEKPVSCMRHDAITTEEWFERYGPVEEALCDVSHLVRNLPKELRQLLAALTVDADQGIKYARGKPGKRTKLRKRQTTNEYWCQIAGIKNDVDVVSMFERYFGVPLASIAPNRMSS